MVAWFTVWRTTIPVGEVRYGCLVHRVDAWFTVWRTTIPVGEVRNGCLVHRAQHLSYTVTDQLRQLYVLPF